jgi:hypothetical protein
VAVAGLSIQLVEMTNKLRSDLFASIANQDGIKLSSAAAAGVTFLFCSVLTITSTLSSKTCFGSLKEGRRSKGIHYHDQQWPQNVAPTTCLVQVGSTPVRS